MLANWPLISSNFTEKGGCQTNHLKHQYLIYTAEFFLKPHAKGTVGAVARDKDGNFAAATSTVGTPFKPLGRVGDTPLCGAGFFAGDQRSVPASWLRAGTRPDATGHRADLCADRQRARH